MGTSAAAARQVLNNFGPLIEKYHGGMPIGFVAAIIYWESSGNPNIVSSLGEWGLLQVTVDTCNNFRVNPSVREAPEGNLFTGLLRYNVDAARIVKRFPWIGSGTDDQWLFSRLVSAIGIGATQNLLNKYTSNRSYADFQAWANAGNASGKTLERINGVVTCWNAGQAAHSSSSGYPTAIPAYVPYHIPSDVAGLLQPPGLLGNLDKYKYPAIIGVAGLLAWYLI